MNNFLKDILAHIVIIIFILIFTAIWIAFFDMQWSAYGHWFAIFFFVTELLIKCA